MSDSMVPDTLKISDPMSASEVDLTDLVRFFVRRRLIIASSTLLTTLLFASLTLVLPKTYEAEVTMLPDSGSDMGDMLANSIASQLGPAANLLGAPGGGNVDMVVEVLNSRTLAERVISRCKLESMLIPWTYRSELLEKLDKMVQVTAPSVKDKLIHLKVAAKRPELARDIANASIGELRGMLNEIGVGSAAKRRRFIEKRRESTRLELESAENSLAQFQSQNRLTSLPETVVSSIRSLGDLERQRIQAEIEIKGTEESLQMAQRKVDSMMADPQSLSELEVKYRGLRAQGRALEQAKNLFADRLAELPPKGMQLARLQRDVQVLNAVYLALSQQLETVAIKENQSSDFFTVIDSAVLPDRPSGPRMLILLALGVVVGFLTGVVGGFLRDRRAAGTGGRPERGDAPDVHTGGK